MTSAVKQPPELWTSEPGAQPGQERIRARIAGLHCSLCTGTIEKALGRMDGVATVAVSLTHEQALVDYDPAVVRADQILGTLRDVGYELYDPRKLRPFEEEEAALLHEGGRLLAAITASLAAIGLIAVVTGVFSVMVPAVVVVVMVPLSYALLRPAGTARAVAGAFAVVVPGVVALVLRATGVLAGPVIEWVAGVLALGVVFGVAHHILRMAYQSARRGILNQHVLLEAGAFAGIIGGVIGLGRWLPTYPTAAFFAVAVLITNYHIFSEWLALLVKTRSSQSVRKLLDLQPSMARIVEETGDEAEIPVEKVAVGDLVRVRPGERVPLDGRIREGRTSLDLALVTGEPVPVDRGPGEEVVSGAINGTGSVLVEVAATSAEGFLAQVVRHVEDARALKPGILHLVDRILRIYTPTILTLSLLALCGWLVGSWAVTGEADVRRAVFAALSVLVMGYPCAVGIAAPLAIVRGTGAAADRGIVMRSGEAFQTLRKVRRIVLDKTGTLTEGKPVVIGSDVLGGTDAELLALAAGAEQRSGHPLARAVVAAAAEQEIIPVAVTDFESITGAGVRAMTGGTEVLVGSSGFLSASGVDMSPLAPRIDQWEVAGNTVIGVARDRRIAGVIALADRVRSDAATSVAAMRAAGMEPVMVTGDNERAARRVGQELGITDIRAGVTPAGKAALVRQLQADGTRVAMVGDGINDAPALMQADVGIAAGGGTDIAIESADIVLLRPELAAVLEAHTISDSSYRRTRANVALAFVFNGLGVPLAATGLVYPVWAMAAMAASVTAIFLNSIGARPTLLIDAIHSVTAGGATTHQQGEGKHTR